MFKLFNDFREPVILKERNSLQINLNYLKHISPNVKEQYKGGSKIN